MISSQNKYLSGLTILTIFILLLRLTHFDDQSDESDRISGRGRGIGRFSTAVALEEPIIPPVKVEYTKLLINGQFVDAASGKLYNTVRLFVTVNNSSMLKN